MTRFASHEEMEDAIADRYDQTITDLENKIEELKHNMWGAEEEAERWEAEYKSVAKLIEWMRNNHPEILTTYEVTQRMED
jgi:archaellum component FlaC